MVAPRARGAALAAVIVLGVACRGAASPSAPERPSPTDSVHATAPASVSAAGAASTTKREDRAAPSATDGAARTEPAATIFAFIALVRHHAAEDRDGWRARFAARLVADVDDPALSLGCDEFLVVFPNAPEAAAVRRARDARLAAQRAVEEAERRRIAAEEKDAQARDDAWAKAEAARTERCARYIACFNQGQSACASEGDAAKQAACFRRVVAPCCANAGSRVAFASVEWCAAFDVECTE